MAYSKQFSITNSTNLKPLKAHFNFTSISIKPINLSKFIHKLTFQTQKDLQNFTAYYNGDNSKY